MRVKLLHKKRPNNFVYFDVAELLPTIRVAFTPELSPVTDETTDKPDRGRIARFELGWIEHTELSPDDKWSVSRERAYAFKEWESK